MFSRPANIRMLALAALLASSVMAQDWAGRGRVQGRVTDENGKGIPNATITIRLADDPEAGPEPFSANKKGDYSYLGLVGANYIISAAAEGYITVERLAQVSEFGSGVRVDIELPANPYGAVNEGNELLDAGDFAGARAKYESVLEKLDAEPRLALQTRIGDTYFEEGNFAAAQSIYEEALPKLPADQQLHVLLRLGECYMQAGEFEAARAQFDGAIGQLPPVDQARVMMKVAQIHDLQGHRDKAIETLEEAQSLDPENVGVLQLLADLLMRVGREEEAQEYLAKLPEGVELPTDMLLNMGIREYNSGNLDGAFTYFEQAVAEHPELAAAYYYRGLVHLSRGANDLARDDLRRFLELDPTAPQAAEAKEFLKFLEEGS